MNSWLPYSAEQPRHGHRWMNIMAKERGQYPRIDVVYRPTPCQHCEDPACAAQFPDQVIVREDGIVLIDPVKSKGNRAMVDSCPFGTIYYNEELDIPQNCTMCVHLMELGQAPGIPRCAHSCPTEAIRYVEMYPEDMEVRIKQEGLQTINDSMGIKTHVLYKNLYRYGKCFISAEVVKDDECAEGVEVTLIGEDIEESQLTDCFGEFKFDDLDPGTYQILIDDKVVKEVTIEKSINAGDIFI